MNDNQRLHTGDGFDAHHQTELLELIDDVTDLRAAQAARAEMCESGQRPIPWEEVRADLSQK
ncbi:MAG: hypothetical protein WA880_01750 [Ornithinimicrobium sp.]